MSLFLFAILAGAVTVAGPCILPLLPIILGTSTTRSHPSRPLFIILGFILSFSLIAIFFAAFGRKIGISPETLRIVATVVIGFFGILMLFPKFQETLFAHLQPMVARLTPHSPFTGEGLWSGFALGASLGLVWTPCAGPILGSILTLVAAQQNFAQAGALLVAYALGAGIPMLAIAYGGHAAVARVRWLAPFTATIQRAFGLLIILVAIGIATGADRDAQAWLVRNAPWLFPNPNLNL